MNRSGLRIIAAGLAVFFTVAGGDHHNPYNNAYIDKKEGHSAPCLADKSDNQKKLEQQPQYVETPYSPYPAGDRPYRAQPPYQQPQYQQQPTPNPYQPQYQQYHQPQQPAHYEPSNDYPQNYPTPSSYQPAYRPQESYGSSYSRPAAYAPKKPAYAAICDFSTGAGSGKVQGRLTLTQGAGYDEAVKISGYISPLKPGKHGFHIHMYGDFSDGCKSAGGHYNPLKVSHGSPQDDKQSRHVGDLGNIEAGYDGVAHIDIEDAHVSLADGGKHPIGGRSFVVHEKPDDLGRGGDEESKKTGNAGARLGCCVIVRVDPEKL